MLSRSAPAAKRSAFLSGRKSTMRPLADCAVASGAGRGWGAACVRLPSFVSNSAQLPSAHGIKRNSKRQSGLKPVQPCAPAVPSCPQRWPGHSSGPEHWASWEEGRMPVACPGPSPSLASSLQRTWSAAAATPRALAIGLWPARFKAAGCIRGVAAAQLCCLLKLRCCLVQGKPLFCKCTAAQALLLSPRRRP